MKKKVTALLAIIIVMSIIMGACGQQGNTPGTATTAAATTTAKAATEAQATAGEERKMEGNLYLEGLPIVKQTEKFTLLTEGEMPGENLTYVPEIEAETNVDIDWLLYSYAEGVEKKNLLINSGDYPEVIGGWLLNENEVLLGARDGLFLPLDAAIAKYAPNITKILDLPGVRETMTHPDGHIYTIPYVLPTPQVSFNPYINQKWLDKLNLKMPTTPDELLDVMRAFRDNDANGNGKKDEIGFSGDTVNTYLGLFAGWWGMACPKSNFTMVNGKLTFAADTEAFKSAIKFFNKVYKEGLFDPEFYTQDQTQWIAKGNQELYGVCFSYGSADFAGEKVNTAAGERTDYVVLPVLKGSPDVTPVWQRDSYGTTVYKTQAAVTDKGANILPTIIRWWDYILSKDYGIKALGPDGKLHKKISDNVFQALDWTKLSEEDMNKYGWGRTFPYSLPTYNYKIFNPPEFTILPMEGAPVAYDEKTPIDQLYAPFLTEANPTAWVSSEDAKRVSILQTDIEKYINDKIAAWVSGQADIDAEWDAYKAQLDKLGLQEYISLKRKAIGQ